MSNYYHFLNDDKKLGYGDGRRVHVGKWYRVKGPIELCKFGMHASKNILDALSYSNSHTLCLVELTDDVIHDGDKSVASGRKIIWMLDVEMILHEFACKCAERALKLANVTDGRCWEAIKVKRKWLKDLATDAELNAARVAGYTAISAAIYTARDAAIYAAIYAARYAARDAARDAAGYARYAASSGEKKWQEKTLLRMIKKARS